MNNKYDKFLISSFCFFGPIGNIIPILPNVAAFRFFYIIIFIGIIYFFFHYKENINAIKFLISYIPFFCILTISALLGAINNVGNDNIEAENPIFRLSLFLSLFVFVVFIGNKAKYFSDKDTIKCIRYYLLGYIISLVVGYIFFIGYYTDILNLDFIARFQVLTQMGYGILRFSPGSYPNEYGIVSSYVLSIITILLYEKKYIIYKKTTLSCLYILILPALFLTTTRAAYIAYIICLIYISLSSVNIFTKIKRSISIVVFSIIILFIVQNYVYDIVNILQVGYQSLGDKDASAYERIIAWNSLYKDFVDNYLWGVGFGKAGGTHNIYIELIFELGLIASCILSFYIFMIIIKLVRVFKSSKPDFIYKICVIGLIHILWFGMSNHNLNHHLTWFVVFTIYIFEFKMKFKSPC